MAVSTYLTQHEVIMGISYISKGLRDYFLSSDNTARSLALADAVRGANILYFQSIMDDTCKSPFPTSIPKIFSLAREPMSSWCADYPFIGKYFPEYDSDLMYLYDEFSLDKTEGCQRILDDRSEEDLYIEFNLSEPFQKIKKMCKTDEEYVFTRVGIPSVLETGIQPKRTAFKGIRQNLAAEIIDLYYIDIDGSYYSTKDGYALCSHCGYLMKRAKHGGVECAVEKCRDYKRRQDLKEEIGSYIKNPQKVLKRHVQTYIKIPSIQEKLLYDMLKKDYEQSGRIQNLKLYPDRDSCDLSFNLKANDKWIVDIKEWVSPYRLAKALEKENFASRNQGGTRYFVLIPDHLAKVGGRKIVKYVQTLKKEYRGNEKLEFMYFRDFLKELDFEAGGAR